MSTRIDHDGCTDQPSKGRALDLLLVRDEPHTITDSLQPATGYNPMPPQHMSCSHCCRPLVEMATPQRWDDLCEQCARGEG